MLTDVRQIKIAKFEKAHNTKFIDFIQNYMDTLKFNSFGNSPKSLSGYPSKLVSQNSLNPNNYQNPSTSIPQLKKQMQQAINSRRSSARSPKILDKYPSNISLMKSDISMISNPQVQHNLPLSLLKLEVGVTEQMLALKQDKLTLMQEHNKLIEQRYRIEREINKIKNKKQRQSSQINQLSVFDIISSAPVKKNQIVARNQELKSQCQELQALLELYPKRAEKPEQKSMFIQIQNLLQSSRTLEQRLSKIQGNSRPTHETSEQRFQTFFPDRKSKDSESGQEKFLRLRQVRYNLYQQLAESLQSMEQKNDLLQLVRQNQELAQQYERQLDKKKSTGIFSRLQFLRQKVNEEQEAKRFFIEDLKKFKLDSQRMKKQNEQMRHRLEFI